MPSRRQIVLFVTIAALLLAAVVVIATRSEKDIIVAASPTTSTPTTGPVVIIDDLPEPTTTAEPPAFAPAVGLKVGTGQPYRPAIPFVSNIPIPSELTFVLVIGSDARPGQNFSRTRADSIHLIAVNPTTMEGTIVGFPRDAWVEIPGRGRGKINSALAMGGPVLMAETVRHLTGLPVHYYVVTGFEGFERLVDDLGGVDMHLDRKMDDNFSGARFEAGWHHFSGPEALAVSRNRKDVPNGDFSRSENQGKLILATLAKMRSEVGNDDGIFHWIGVLGRHVALDVPADHLPRLAALGRRVDPGRVKDVVLPGRVGYAGRQSVVFLTEDAPRLFDDLRPDAVIGSPEGTPPPEPAPPPPPPEETTTTTAPPPESPTTSSTTTTTSLLGL
jgi:LCP family protein required for cell wall assembly